MKPKTLEEAIAMIEQLGTQVTSLQTERDTAIADKKKILEEKKDVLKLFDEKQKEGMTESEKVIAEQLETERAERIRLETQIKTDAETRNKTETDRVAKAIEERIVKISKGDAKVADELRANVALLEKLPRSSDSEMDTVINSAWNMRGTNEAAPLNLIHSTSGGAPKVEEKSTFSETPKGKAVADKLGLSIEPAKKEGAAE